MNNRDRLMCMNRVKSIIMVTILIISFLLTSFAYAVDPMEVSLLADVNVEKGATVTVPLTFKNVPPSGIYTCSFWVLFDPQVYTSVSILPGDLITNTNDLLTNVNMSSGFAAMIFEAPVDGSRMIKKDGTFVKLQFAVAENAYDGIYNLVYGDARCAVYATSTDEITGIKYNTSSITVGKPKIPVTPTITAPVTTTPAITPTATPATEIPATETPTTATPSITPAVSTSPTPGTTTLVETTMMPSTDVTPTPTNNVTATPAPTGGFVVPSDISTHWAKLNILKLISRGVIQGYPDGTIKPDNSITRAETVTALMKAMGYSPAENPEFTFADNKDIPAWVRGFLKTALDHKVVSGYEDNTFRASRNVTRQEVVVMLMKTFGFAPSESSALNFADGDKIAAWSKNYIIKACELGIVKGYEDNTFKASKNVTRAELFTMISNCINYIEAQ